MPSTDRTDRDGTYLVDMEELDFFLWEQFPENEALLAAGPHSGWDRDRFARVLTQAQAFARKLGDAYQDSDREGCTLDAQGNVRLPSAYPALWEEFRKNWVVGKPVEGEPAGADDPVRPILPPLLAQVVYEMFMGANPSFMTYGGFSRPASKIIHRSGTPEQKAAFFPKLHAQEWDACFCSSEAQAGSDVTALHTVGTPIEGGGDLYSIVGEKRFISAGMHQLTDNTLYFVLGRVDSATPGSFSLSCFIVPKYLMRADGSRVSNHVECLRLEDKMGLNGCANTQLRFGHAGPTHGHLLGNRKNVGLLQLMPLMADARMTTGLFALGMASSAYHHSLRYARSRIQGRPFHSAANALADRVSIIEHLDVQRMLLEMKSKVEGCRGLLGKMSLQLSRQLAMRKGPAPDDKALDRAQRLILFYVPIVKAYVSDQAWRICELGIQVHGGVGYTKDTPVEQYARDVKVLSIWEGTNYIQSQDLLREKLSFGRDSRTIRYFREDVEAFLDTVDVPDLADECARLREALAASVEALDVLGGIVKSGRMERVSQYSTRLLEMLAETSLGWVLLEAAVAAKRALARRPAGDPKAAFYLGKVDSARFFIHNILPAVHTRLQIMRNHEHSLVAMSSERFGYLAPETLPAQEAALCEEI
ncbi:acyl-CoA dehydrogenase [Ramlibacter sp.]|uniref:acyl-CoA dehydrogenase n=1 Tax=Ramlibacter sp. TaxID=1917967 RepID=UPI0017AABF7E|nr:acyl-CoA dehydrogenase [Ramlibacter sp.]MBA2674448.1 acyl-CoA dehydrogenase [Ramlibacter sp.]